MNSSIVHPRTLSGTALLLAAASLATPSAVADTFGSGTNQFTMDFVRIGNAGNPDDTAGLPYAAGAVAYDYRMGKYEVSEAMITKAGAEGLTGVSLELTRGADKPATTISWYDAARFVNWLNESTGHAPAYRFDGNGAFQLWPSGEAWQRGGQNLYRHREAQYFLPGENEWYKAAFYNGMSYVRYPTGSNLAPTPVPGGTEDWTAVFGGQSGPAEVASAGGLSPYGTMGQGGNVWEWMESAIDGGNDSEPELRVMRGGGWFDLSGHDLSSSARYEGSPSEGSFMTGFRVAAAVADPTTAGVKSFVIEAEDFDYAGGQHQTNASVMPYLGGAYADTPPALAGVDFDRAWPREGDPDNYRLGELPNVPMASRPELADRGEWEMTVNYAIGWTGFMLTGWYNYTRVFPPGNYQVYAVLAFGEPFPDGLHGELGRVIGGVGTQQQIVEPLGTCRAPGTGDWGLFTPVPVVEGDQPAVIALAGLETLRFTHLSGDFDYLLFVNQNPTPWQDAVRWSQPGPEAVFVAPADMVFEVALATPARAVAEVRYYRGTELLGRASLPPYRCVWRNAPEGDHELVATVVDGLGQERASDRVHVSVRAAGADAPLVLNVADATVNEDPLGTTNLTFEVRLSKPSVERVEVRYLTVAGSAREGADFVPSSGTLVFEPGMTTTLVTVTVLSDEAIEPDETLSLVLSGPLGATFGRAQATGTIREAVPILPWVTLLTPTNHQVLGFGETVRIVASPVATVGGVARVELFGDGELLGEVLEPPYIWDWRELAPGTHQIVAWVFDTMGRSSAGDAVAIEVLPGGTLRWVNPGANGWVVLGQPTPLEVVFDGAGVVIQRVEFLADGETVGVAEEAPFRWVWSPLRAGVGYLGAVAWDLEGKPWPAERREVMVALGVSVPEVPVPAADTLPVLTVADAFATVPEVEGPGTMVRFFVRLSQPASVPVSVDCTTRDGPAGAGADYTPVRGTLVFPPGTTEQVVHVPVASNAPGEPDEWFTLELTNALGCHLATSQASGHVYGEGSYPVMDVGDVFVAEGDAGFESVARVLLRLSRPPVRSGWVRVGSSPLTAQEFRSGGLEPGAEDYRGLWLSVGFAAGQTEAFVDVPIVGDEFPEPDENFWVWIAGPEYCRIGRDTAVVTILNDDPGPAVGVRDARVSELTGGRTNLLFNIWLSKPASEAVEVGYATRDGAALAGLDYEPAAGVVRYEPGETNAVVEVVVLPDAVREPEEDLRLELTVPAGGGAPVRSSVGRIFDAFNLTPTVSIALPTNGAVTPFGEWVLLVAVPADVEGRVSRVEFLADGVPLGSATEAPYAWSWTSAPPGPHTVLARAFDESGAASSSQPVTLDVQQVAPLRWQVPTPGAGAVVGAVLRLRAALEDGGVELASVEYEVNGLVVGTAETSPFEVPWTPGAAGTYALRALGRDTVGGTWASDPLTVVAGVPSPANDAWASAFELQGFHLSVAASNLGAGREAGEPLHHAADTGGSLWYRWLTPGDGLATVRVRTEEGEPALAAFYTGSAPNTLVPAATVTGDGTLSLKGGQSFWVVLDTLGGGRGDLRFELVLSDVQLIHPADGAIWGAPTDTLIEASVSAPEDAIRHVEFLRRGESLGRIPTPPYRLVLTNTANGYHDIVARAVDILGGERVSPSLRFTIRPENDDFERATTLSGYRVSVRASNEAATFQGTYTPPWGLWIGEPRDFGDNQGGHSIWYQWTAPEDGLCTVRGHGDGFGAMLGAHVGTRVDQLRCVGANPFSPPNTPLQFPVTATTNYYIAVDGLFSEEGRVELAIELHPRNDDFANRARIDSVRAEVLGWHRGASQEGAAEATALGNDEEASVWWGWTPPGDGLARVTCRSAGAGRRLAVFTGNALIRLAVVAVSGESPTNPAQVAFDAVAGVEYQVAVLGDSADLDDFTLEFVQPRLRITNPLPGSAHAGPVTLELTAAMDGEHQPGKVEYFLGTNSVGASELPPFVVVLRDLGAGTHTLSATATFTAAPPSTSLPVTVLVYQGHEVPRPRVFAGQAGHASFWINALGELRVTGFAGAAFGLRGPREWFYPRIGQTPSTVDGWATVQAGFSGSCWALSTAGRLIVDGELEVPPPAGVGRWVALRVGAGGTTFLVADDGRIYDNGKTLLDFGEPTKRWTDIVAGAQYHCTLDDTGWAYMHTRDAYARRVTQPVPFPGGMVRPWVQMDGGLPGALLKDQDAQLYLASPFGPRGEHQATLAKIPNPPGVTHWLEFVAGGLHFLAIGSDGQLYGWGRNWEGQLGSGGAGGEPSTPQKVPLPPGVTAWAAVAAGYMHSLAIGNDCALYGWGANDHGQLGIGPIPSPTFPVRIDNAGVVCGFPVVFQEGRLTLQEDGTFRIRFTSDLNRTYSIQYSPDARSWRTAATPVIGNGGLVEWLDIGPPETESAPISVSERFYRIVFAP